MSNHVVMPKADWQDILSAVRDRTGSAELLKSGDVATAVNKTNDRVAYIESDGTQYIDTKFVPGGSTKVVIDAAFVSGEHEGADALFGARNGTTGNFVLMRPGTSNTSLRSDYDNNMDSTFSAIGTERAVYVKDRGKTYKNGELVCSLANSSFSSKYTMYLMGVNSQDLLRFPAAVRVYGCQIYDNDSLVRDFVPWKTKGGTIGLFDRVQGKLYTDAAGGKFTCG